MGHRFNAKAITGIASHYGESKITIGAQLYLKKFYESHGFCTSEMYLEDDIPHRYERVVRL
jgi:ElaA protein